MQQDKYNCRPWAFIMEYPKNMGIFFIKNIYTAQIRKATYAQTQINRIYMGII